MEPAQHWASLLDCFHGSQTWSLPTAKVSRVVSMVTPAMCRFLKRSSFKQRKEARGKGRKHPCPWRANIPWTEQLWAKMMSRLSIKLLWLFRTSHTRSFFCFSSLFYLLRNSYLLRGQSRLAGKFSSFWINRSWSRNFFNKLLFHLRQTKVPDKDAK